MFRTIQPSPRLHRVRSVFPARRSAHAVAIVVVIPVRNEERRLDRCLDALDLARRNDGGRPGVRVVLVLDRCTDGSAGVAAARDWVETVVTDHGRVGSARAAGVAHALAGTGQSLRSTWIACTDGDSAVPADWLQTQRSHAASGTDLLLGTVRPDPGELSPAALRRWHSQHSLLDGHPHIFGANLGVNAAMYVRAGGFPPVVAHEDLLLSDAVRRLRGRVVSTASSPVLTSGRTDGRTGAGFAEFLTAMGQGVDSEDSAGKRSQPSSPEACATEMAGGRM